MAYTTDIVYREANQEEAAPRAAANFWSRQRFFLLLFAIGTLIAAIGWVAEWMHLADSIPFFRYSVIVTVVGHALEVIGAFGLMIAPDYVEEEGDIGNKD